jgi:hypothetical protein
MFACIFIPINALYNVINKRYIDNIPYSSGLKYFVITGNNKKGTALLNMLLER